MSSLTIFIIPADNSIDLQKAVRSVIRVADTVIPLNHRNIEKELFRVKTSWFGYIFSDEYLSVDLQRALPFHLRMNKADCLSILRKVTEDKYTQSPRIFRKYVKIDVMQPISSEAYIFDRILDGFVYGNNSYVSI